MHKSGLPCFDLVIQCEATLWPTVSAHLQFSHKNTTVPTFSTVCIMEQSVNGMFGFCRAMMTDNHSGNPLRSKGNVVDRKNRRALFQLQRNLKVRGRLDLVSAEKFGHRYFHLHDRKTLPNAHPRPGSKGHKSHRMSLSFLLQSKPVKTTFSV